VEHSPDLMLPGVSEIPDNAVVALETNPDFVAALLVGANHEMTRELLWRGPSTDLRATVFRRFWDVRGASPTGPQCAFLHGESREQRIRRTQAGHDAGTTPISRPVRR
jgi:hypothetical protein